jgi:arylsulfatase A-like enzyme
VVNVASVPGNSLSRLRLFVPAGLGCALAWLGRFLWQPLVVSSDRRRGADLMSLTFAVCLAIFLTKLILATLDLADPRQPPLLFDGDWLPSLARVFACCAEDGAVGLSCVLLAAVALRLGSAPCYRVLVRGAIYLAAVAALFLTVVDAHLFHQMRRFLTFELFEAGGGFTMETSVEDYANSPAFKATVVLLPVLTLTFHLGTRQALGRLWRGAAGLLGRPVVLLPAIAVLMVGGEVARSAFFVEGHTDFAQNPQLLLARSFFVESAVAAFAGPSPGEGDNPWPADFVDDFRPGRARFSATLAEKRPQNIIVIAVESLGARYLQVCGAPFPNTPNLCRLQRRGIVFTNFYATANKTMASALPLFGSLYNDLTARQGTLMAYEDFPIPAASVWLKQHGYRTYFLTANGGAHGGWDSFLNIRACTQPGMFDVGRDPANPFWSKDGLDPQRIFRTAAEGNLDEAVFADARRVLHDAAGHKFYLMLCNYETHYPYYPGRGPGKLDESRFPQSLVNQDQKVDYANYLKSIWRLDALVGDLYAELEKLGLAEDTLLVITGDHGEAWGQHGTWIHGDSVYEEEVHVPLLLINPRLAAAGRHLDVVGSHVDLWPTLMDICGLPADPRWQGRSLLGGRPGETRRAYFSNYGNSVLGLREGKYKYCYEVEKKRDRLFDLAEDPDEQHDMASQMPAYCEQLRRRLQVWVQYQARLTRQYAAQATAAATP